MKSRIVKLLGAGALLAGLLPLTACATPYAYGDEVRTSVTYVHGSSNGYWSHGRYYAPPRFYYYAPPRFYSPHAYSRWYSNQPNWWRKRNPYHWDQYRHYRDRDHDHDWRDHDRRNDDHRWN